jgi:hypothetical protein
MISSDQISYAQRLLPKLQAAGLNRAVRRYAGCSTGPALMAIPRWGPMTAGANGPMQQENPQMAQAAVRATRVYSSSGPRRHLSLPPRAALLRRELQPGLKQGRAPTLEMQSDVARRLADYRLEVVWNSHGLGTYLRSSSANTKWSNYQDAGRTLAPGFTEFARGWI